MYCAACDVDNAPGARFCSGCGEALERICDGCGHASGSQARFCSACGRRLLPGTAANGDAEAHVLAGERRQLTVLFCDVVGSTELTARFDPEDWQTISARYQRCGVQAVERFGGHVASFAGDGFLASFGYPLAHDDDPERGIRAAIGILDALTALNRLLDREYGVRLAVRIGVHTGEVVIGEGGGGTTELFGEAVHVAARVQQLAGPDEVLITDPTCRLVSGLFVMEEGGAHTLRGIPEPVTLHRVLEPSGARGRLQRAAARGLTPFVGRDMERALLRSRWDRAQDAQGQVVFISGEPGIGKSRLLQVFREDIAGCSQTWVECAASPYHETSPFFCVSDMLQQALVRQCGDSEDEWLLQLDRAVATSGLDPQESVPLIAGLIGLALPPGRYPALGGSPGQRRQRLLTVLVHWVLGLAAFQPVVLVVEDLMWADPSTLEFLGLLGQQVATAPVLLLYTARPEFPCPWPVHSHCTTVALNRLDDEQVRQMIGVGTGSAAQPDLLRTLVQRSDGVPLFAEELTRLMRDSTGRFVQGAIPETLQDLLAARLDRLGPARQVAQIGAVIGREFSYELLQAVASHAVPDLDASLASLTDAELLHAHGFPPQATYAFKHALIRDAAYGSLLKSRRRELHVAIARALTAGTPGATGRSAELLAHHFTQAGEVDAAWRAWQRAGELAVARSALLEAADHFASALRLLESLPDTPELAQQALNLQVLFGQVLAATKGYGASEVTQAFGRARDLASKRGGTPELLSVLFGLWSSIAGQGELRVAHELADELLAVAERSGLVAETVWGHLAHGINQYSRGDAAAARERLARVVTLYGEGEPPARPSDPGVMALSYASVNSWMLGLVDEARAHSRAALALARRLGTPFAEAWAGFFTAALHVLLREPERALEHTDPLIAMCTEHEFPLFVGLTTIVRGAAISQAGRHEEGVAELRQGIDLYSATGQRVSRRLYLCWLAQACTAAGRVEEAADAVAEALVIAPDERLFEAEVHRVRAEVLLRQGAPAASAETSFRTALELARGGGARSLELRAVVSYARWLAGVGRADEARGLLREACAGFPDGLVACDVEEARALLGELSA
jgi:class 3 adenylate cyclase/predicted ATPase